MRNRGERLLGVVFVALFSAFSVGCVDLDTGPIAFDETTTGSSGAGGHAGQGGQTGLAGSPGTGGVAGAGGEALSGGPISSEWVGATGVSKSGSYKMEFSFGQPFNQQISSSTSYRLQMGAVGAAWSEQ